MLIQKLRLQRGWSQEDLAALSGLSVRTIQRLERGQPGSLESMKALAAVFEVELNTLQEPAMDTAPTELPQDEALALAHVRRLKSLYIHMAQYVIVIALLAVINLITLPGYLWFIWPALGWGVGIAFHAASVFHLGPFDGAWEKRQVEKHLGRRI